MDEKKRTPGICERHAKACATRAKGSCDCTPTYEAYVWDAKRGRQTSKVFKTRSEAKTWHRENIAAAVHGTLAPRRDSTPRLGEALEALLEAMRDGTALTRSGTRYRPGSIRTYAYQVAVWEDIAHLRLHEVHRRDIQRIVDQLRAERSASAVHNALDPLRILFRRALRDELVQRNPTDYLELPAIRRKPIDVTRAEDPAAVLAPLPEDLRALWATAMYAGLRRGELRALRWKDIDLHRGVIVVSRGWDDIEGEQETKTMAGERTVPIVEDLARELARHGLSTERSGSDLVFGRTASEPFSTSSVDRFSKEAWKKAKIKGPTLHTGRHATVSHLIRAGLDAKSIQTYAGHSSIKTTYDVYGHWFPSTVDSDRDRLNEYHRAAKPRTAPETKTD